MQGKLAKATESTGGVKLIWSTRLRTAAGRAHWNRLRGTGSKDQHHLEIELSTKIITDEGFFPEIILWVGVLGCLLRGMFSLAFVLADGSEIEGYFGS